MYAREIILRTCGRLSVVASDFGADYRTHTHVTAEALYASLSRGATWRRGWSAGLANDTYDFGRDYDLNAWPIWFTPGVFVSEAGYRLDRHDLDSTAFNAVAEVYPSTSQGFTFSKKGEFKGRDRPGYVPTYGAWQAVLPNRRMVTYAFAQHSDRLQEFAEGQTFLLGKKRTMVQIVQLSSVTEARQLESVHMTPFLQVAPVDVGLFARYEVVAGTTRYLIMRGELREVGSGWIFPLNVWGVNYELAVPGFYLKNKVA